MRICLCFRARDAISASVSPWERCVFVAGLAGRGKSLGQNRELFECCFANLRGYRGDAQFERF